MNLYFDESGQTGCVYIKDNSLNFKSQPMFAIGTVITQNSVDDSYLREKYAKFKDRFGITGEIKGSELVTRKRNQELNYFIDNILDDKHFEINIYDKKFYLSTQLVLGLLGYNFQKERTVDFYRLASMLAFEEDSFFIEYCKYITCLSPESFHDYLIFLTNYRYMYISKEQNGIQIMSEKILEMGDECKFYNSFLTFGWYKDKHITNLINLNALIELIYSVKLEKTKQNSDIYFIHDRIEEFEKVFVDELSSFNIQMSFLNSQDDLLLQLSDNITSLFCHAFTKVKGYFLNKKQWEASSEWEMKLLERLMRKLTNNNIKFTVPIPDWSMALCVQDMFADSYPPSARKNIFFNPKFDMYQLKIYQNLDFCSSYIPYIRDVLKK